MVCKMLLFEYRDVEKPFFEKNHLDNFNIKFYTEILNEKNVANLDLEDLENTVALSIYKFSKLTSKVLQVFKNLRVISIRTNDYKQVDLQSCINRNIAVVNVDNTDNEYAVLKSVFQYTTDVLCGGKKNRIV